MGRMQREKGKAFERRIAGVLRERWGESVVVKRSSQAERADNADLITHGGPPALARLWLELNDAAAPRPLDKLDQAERDTQAAKKRFGGAERMPVIVWHKKGERSLWATCRLETVRVLAGWPAMAAQIVWPHVVTMALDDLLDLVETAH
jgi:hypothetical protein